MIFNGFLTFIEHVRDELFNSRLGISFYQKQERTRQRVRAVDDILVRRGNALELEDFELRALEREHRRYITDDAGICLEFLQVRALRRHLDRLLREGLVPQKLLLKDFRGPSRSIAHLHENGLVGESRLDILERSGFSGKSGQRLRG